MALYVLDTDTLTLFAQGNPNVTGQVRAHVSDELCAAVISVQEMIEGWLGFIKRQTRPYRVAHGYDRLGAAIPLLACITIKPSRESTMNLYTHLRGCA